MPNYFALCKKGTTERVPFSQIDDEICAALGFIVDADKYAYHWYDIIGLRLAMGQNFDQIIEAVSDEQFPELGNIARWLKENYTSDAWAMIGRR